MWILETPNTVVSNYLMNYLAQRKLAFKAQTSHTEAFQVLIATTNPSLWTLERMDVAKVALLPDTAKRAQVLARHAKKYEWLEYGLQGKFLDLSYFEKELGKILEECPEKVLKTIQEEFALLKQKQSLIEKEYKIDKTFRHIFAVVRDSNYSRLYSKYSQFFGYYAMEKLYREISLRGGLSLEQVRFLGHEDFRKVLLDKKDFKKITPERMKHSLHISYGKGKTVYYYGRKADEISKKIKLAHNIQLDLSSSVKTLEGQSAYNGKIQGRVKVINTVSELGKIHEGNILVSHMTNPDIVPAMKMARAIVTDLGGITCHAAIVARELKKPCIIGTKITTKVLKDGDLVEVNADVGTVTVIERSK